MSVGDVKASTYTRKPVYCELYLKHNSLFLPKYNVNIPCWHLQLSSALHLQAKEMVSWSLSAWKLTVKDFELHCPVRKESHSLLLSFQQC